MLRKLSQYSIALYANLRQASWSYLGLIAIMVACCTRAKLTRFPPEKGGHAINNTFADGKAIAAELVRQP
jgi:hypothetical protein